MATGHIMNPGRQTGAALLTSLLILLVLSLLAVASMQNVSLQERMVSAVKDGQIALEAAEYAARQAELALENDAASALGNFKANASKGGLYLEAEAPDAFAASTWVPANDWSIGATGFPTTELAEAPRYFIEYVGQVKTGEQANDLAIGNYGGAQATQPPEGYRIVAWSSGRTGQTRRIVEVFYGKAL